MRIRYLAIVAGLMVAPPAASPLAAQQEVPRRLDFTADTVLPPRPAERTRELLNRIHSQEGGGDKIRQSDLTQALDRVAQLQSKLNIRPPVLTYEPHRRRLFLADRSFLFYRKYGKPTWPWRLSMVS